VTTLFEDEVAALGFRLAGASRWGGRMWSLGFNRHLEFTLHDYEDRALLSWAFAFGDHAMERGWRLSVSDPSLAELYPANDVVVARDVDAVRTEITRVLGTLRLDLGDPEL
jgi:hypothetical protein